MMKKITLFLVLHLLIISSNLYANNISMTVGKNSYRTIGMTSCYRWMGKAEMKTWFKKKKPYFAKIIDNHLLLDRGGKVGHGIYCWSSPAASIQGGSSEIYGDYLVRIDLLPQAIIYDRNLNSYSHLDATVNSEILANEKKGIDSDIFYANYDNNKYSWFQEYIIKSTDIIVGWSFGDEKLRSALNDSVEAYNKGQIAIEDFHFFANHCPYQTSESDADSILDFYRDSERYECEKYRQELERKRDVMVEFWARPGSDQYIKEAAK